MASRVEPHPGKQVSCPRAVIDGAGQVVALVPARKRVYNPRRAYVVKAAVGRKFQARFFLGGRLNSVNLGLYESEERAGAVAAAFKARGGFLSAERYVEVLAELVAAGVVPPHVLPKWVYAIEGGGYGAKTRTAAGAVHLKGPYATPAEAFRRMVSRLTRAA